VEDRRREEETGGEAETLSVKRDGYNRHDCRFYSTAKSRRVARATLPVLLIS
jgi:hypothetical protein